MNSPELMPEGKFLGQWPWEGKGVSSAQQKGVFMGSQDKQSFTGNISLGGWSHRKQKWGKREGGGKGREANVSSSLWSSVSHLSTILSILDELLLTEMSKAHYLLIDHCTISEADENISSSFIFKKRKIENHAYEGTIRKQQAKEKESIIIISPLLKVVRGYYC